MKAEPCNPWQFEAREILRSERSAVFEHAAVEMRQHFLTVLNDVDLYRLLEQPSGMERLQLEGRFALP